MKRLLSLFFCGSMVCAADLPLSIDDRVVIFGDSGADAKKWSHYVASYLLLMNPTLNLHVQVEGRGGATVQTALTDPGGYDGYDEYPKRVASYEPDFVLVNFGINGGSTPAEFIASMTDLGDNYIVSGGATPILISPQPLPQADGKARSGLYEDEEQTLTTARSWPMAAIWTDLFNIWTNSNNWILLSEELDDHPDTSGHILIAHSIITTLGWETSVSQATINASSFTITSSNHCTIGTPASNAFSGVDFTRLDERLPWAVDQTQDGLSKAVTMRPAVATWQDYSVTVTGLSAGTYDILVDGSLVATASHTALAAGLNMFTWQQGPIFNQLQEVLGRIRDMHWVDRTTLANRPNPAQAVQKYKSNATSGYSLGLRDQALIDSLSVSLGQIATADALIHSAAQPVTRTFSIRKQGGGAIVAPRSRGILLSGTR